MGAGLHRFHDLWLLLCPKGKPLQALGGGAVCHFLPHADWEEALEQLPADALRCLLHDLATRDEFLRERLVQIADGPGDTQELWKLDLERMMNRYVPYGDWFD